MSSLCVVKIYMYTIGFWLSSDNVAVFLWFLEFSHYATMWWLYLLIFFMSVFTNKKLYSKLKVYI